MVGYLPAYHATFQQTWHTKRNLIGQTSIVWELTPANADLCEPTVA